MPYLTAQQVRDRARSDDLSDADLFSDDTIEDLIAEFEEIAEDYCGQAFITRASTDEVHEVSCADLLVVNRPLIAVSAITLEDDAFTSYALDNADKTAGIIRFTSTVTGTIELTYTYGWATCPQRIQRACVQYVRATALRDDSTTGRDVISEAFDGASTRYNTPDWDKGRPTGYIDVDKALNSFGRDIPGVA